MAEFHVMMTLPAMATGQALAKVFEVRSIGDDVVCGLKLSTIKYVASRPSMSCEWLLRWWSIGRVVAAVALVAAVAMVAAVGQ